MSKNTNFNILGMMEAFKKSIPTREESYREVLGNPNSFNFWFRRLVGFDDACPFKIPQTICFELPFERWEWLTHDEYTPEAIEEFNSYLNGILLRSKLNAKEYFIKTGTFSNKFDFKSCHITDKSELGDKFLDVFYTDMTVGAGNTPHVVIREFIPSSTKYFIYNGMPLRRELRFFWDFDEIKLLGHSIYWHPEEMKELIHNPDDYYRIEDYNTFASFHEENKDLYEKDLNNIIPNLIEFLSKNKDLTDDPLKGKWSIDIMHEDGEYYLIDAAQMNKSALVNRMESCIQ